MPLKDPEARKQYQKEYAQRNRDKAYQKVKEWRAANPEKWAEQQQRYAEKHPEKLVAKTIRWRQANPERSAEVSRQSRLRHKDRVLANKAKYRAGKSNRTPAWLTEIDFERMRNEYKLAVLLTKVTGEQWEVDHIIPLHTSNFERMRNEYKLAVLLTKVTGEQWEVDHIIPLHGNDVSGLHVPSNLRAIKASENRLKNSKFEVEYA